MKFLHDPDLRVHTVHVVDVCQALVATAKWMTENGRSHADELTGEQVVSAWTSSKAEEKEAMKMAEVVDEGQVVRLPIFNVVRSHSEATWIFG